MTGAYNAGSIRTDGDSWDITESVGATALSVAAARAVETVAADPLIRDQFAYLLVSTAGQPWARLASSLDWIGDDHHGRRAHRLSVDYQAVRTHYFDSYFAEAAAAGIRQVVILAAGLDSRAFRLDWPAGTTVYEIDQPQVVHYKTTTLESAGAAPTADRRPIQVDLRDDWAAALTAAGFASQYPHGKVVDFGDPAILVYRLGAVVNQHHGGSAAGFLESQPGAADFKIMLSDRTRIDRALHRLAHGSNSNSEILFAFRLSRRRGLVKPEIS